MLTLANFEKNLSSKILKKGLDYYEQDAVDDLEKVSSGLWCAIVHGSESYIVKVSTNKTRIKSWDCNCPYDYGPICKHVVAVFYAISNEIIVLKKVSKKKTHTKDKTLEIFKKADKKGLQDFITSQFRESRGLKSAFIAHFSDLIDEELDVKYRMLVKNVYKAAKGRYGYIDYYNSPKLVKPLDKLLDKALLLMSNKNYRESLVICQTIVEEMPFIVNNMDDSNGESTYLFEKAIDCLLEIANTAPPMLKDELFDYSLLEYPKKKYSDFGFDDNFLLLLPQLITLKEQEERFFNLIDEQLEKIKGNSYESYYATNLIKIKINYYKSRKKEEQANRLIEEHIIYPDFRKIIVKNKIALKEYGIAKSLCEEGHRIATKQKALGDENYWVDELLFIAEKEKNKEEIRKWANKRYNDSHYNITYYKKLKATYKEEEWNLIRQRIITKLKGNKYVHTNIIKALCDIYVEEKDWAILLKQLQLNHNLISFLDMYAHHLLAQYPKEIITAYKNSIIAIAKSTGKSVYNEVAKYLKKVEKMQPNGKEEVKYLLKYFKETYKNRPTMLEILNKKFDF